MFSIPLFFHCTATTDTSQISLVIGDTISSAFIFDSSFALSAVQLKWKEQKSTPVPLE